MVVVLQLAVQAEAGGLVSLEQVTPGVYNLTAVNFSNIGGVEVEIQYDTATLANPRITPGAKLASASFFPNKDCNAAAVAARVCTALHNIKIAAMTLTPIDGSGVLAVLSFDVVGGTAGYVSIVRPKLSDVKGTAVKADIGSNITAGSVSGGGSSSGGGGGGGTDGGSSGSSGTVSSVIATSGGGISVSGGPSAGTITLPQDQIAAAESGRKTEYQPLVTDLRKDMTLPLTDAGGQQSSTAEQKAEPGKEQQKKFISYQSALQLFKGFKGDKSAKNLISIFAETTVPGFKQEPPIAFSDGVTPLKITLAMKQTGGESPKFLLQGANVKQLGGEGEETITWTIDAIPKKDVVEAILTVIDGQTVMEIPLTVAPKINPLLGKTKLLSEADFSLYLSSPAKFDLNNDQKFDAIDDYIYAANYIVAMKIKPEKVKKDEDKEPPKADKKGDSKVKEPARTTDERAKPAEKAPVKP